MWMGAVMRKPSTSFQLGDVITGEPHLYVPSPSAPSDSFVESPAAEQARLNFFRQFFAGVRRTFRLGPTPEDSLARAFDKAFMP